MTRTPRTQSLTKAEYEALAAFRRALRQFTAFSAEAARKAGLTPQQHQALLAIKGAPGREMLAVGEIAEALCLRPHSAVELVDRMAELGLVQRHADARRSPPGLGQANNWRGGCPGAAVGRASAGVAGDRTWVGADVGTVQKWRIGMHATALTLLPVRSGLSRMPAFDGRSSRPTGYFPTISAGSDVG